MPKAAPKPDLPTLSFAGRVEFESWLGRDHATSPGIWLAIAKADSGQETVTYAEALEIALCYGWIDGQKRALDEKAWLQKFCPRGPRSIWSKVNCAKAEALIAKGAMKPAGLAAVAAAKADGRWQSAYDSPANARVPPDLAAALAKDPVARNFFAELDSHNRYAILHRLMTAKKPESRAKRLSQYVAMLRNGETLHPRRGGA